MKPAFSTVACPDWTLPHIAERAEAWGFLGVELRTFGSGGSSLACEPWLTAPAKTRAMFRKAGVQVLSLATSIRFDEPVTPPVIGHVFDTERSVRESRSAVSLAIQLECPFVRVFGFEIIGNETRKKALARIVDRLSKAADHCDKSGVRLLLENGGSFATATDLAEIIDRVNSPLLGASYSLPVAAAAGEHAANAVNVLGDHLLVARVKDFKGARPCLLGEGDLHARDHVAALGKAGFAGWLVYEADRLWFSNGPSAEECLSHAAKSMFEWTGASARPWAVAAG